MICASTISGQYGYRHHIENKKVVLDIPPFKQSPTVVAPIAKKCRPGNGEQLSQGGSLIPKRRSFSVIVSN